MSLRDQLVAKGVASKKQARDAERSLKKRRKQQQGARARKHEETKAAQEAAAQEAERLRQQRLRDKEAARAAREAHEHAYRVRQIVDANRLGGRGPHRFYCRVGQTSRILRLSLPDALVRDLRMGRAAIAGYLDEAGEPVARVVSRKAIDKLAHVAPEALWHRVTGGPALDDPSESPWPRPDWEPSLRPHRWTGSEDRV